VLNGDFECRVVRLTDDVALDFTTRERFVGIEVLGAGRLFEKPESPSIELKERIDLKKFDPAIGISSEKDPSPIAWTWIHKCMRSQNAARRTA
jgi:hypothetical protein